MDSLNQWGSLILGLDTNGTKLIIRNIAFEGKIDITSEIENTEENFILIIFIFSCVFGLRLSKNKRS